MSWADALGYIGGLFVIATYSMKTMVPLRVLGIVTNCIFLTYGYFIGAYPTLIGNLILLPLNLIRLYQMLQLVNKVKEAGRGDLSMDWLKPFMNKRRYRRGDVIFRKGDAAQEMFYTVSGRFRLIEMSHEIGPGELVGEFGLLAPDQRRTQGLECLEDGEVLTISYDQVRQLYFQDPKFGFYFLRLTSGRLFENLSRLEDELARCRGSA